MCHRPGGLAMASLSPIFAANDENMKFIAIGFFFLMITLAVVTLYIFYDDPSKGKEKLAAYETRGKKPIDTERYLEGVKARLKEENFLCTAPYDPAPRRRELL